jgi:hypothetical protein
MLNVMNHLNMLGLKVEDRVTGFKGVVTSVGFDLYGCVQAIVNPGTDKDGKTQESSWFDIARLRVTEDEPVMDRPDFDYESPEGKQAIAEGRKGPAERPRFLKP